MAHSVVNTLTGWVGSRLHDTQEEQPHNANDTHAVQWLMLSYSVCEPMQESELTVLLIGTAQLVPTSGCGRLGAAIRPGVVEQE